MEYLNFDLRIGARNKDLYPVTVIRSPAGEVNALVSLPVEDALFQKHVKEIEILRGEKKTRSVNDQLDTSTRQLALRSKENEVDSLKAMGTSLFDKLFSTEIRSCYQASLQLARKEKKGLRILLRTEPPELAALPWEYLFDPSAGDFLCLSTETPLIRFLEVARPIESLTTTPPLNILGVVANPRGLPALDVDKEKAQMAIAIEHLIDKGFITLTWMDGQTWRELKDAMRDGTWHILHFIGHGGFNADTGEGSIALANEDGSTYELTATNLGRLLSGHRSMRLAVLNSCEGARTGTELFSSVGANLIRRGIPAVVSMQYEISDRAALEFSRSFYESIAEGMPVDAAMQEARQAMNFAISGSAEWGTPVLYMRSPDGRLFDIDVPGAIFPDAPERNQPPIWERNQVSSLQADKPSLAYEDEWGLNILRKKVWQFWIEGVLTPSIKHSALIKLGLDNMPDMVDSPWGSMSISGDHSIGKSFNEVGRSLLILGEPGVGKTIMMLTLTRELLRQYEDTPGLPLPVVFNLTSWTPSGKGFAQWLADEMSMKYIVPRKIGREWLEQNRLLLLLDGLDEVSAGRRNDCVQAINAFLGGRGNPGVVVCCRFREYVELDDKLAMNGAIRLRLLSKEKIFSYLTAAGDQYSGLRELVQRDSSFLKLAETPLLLSLMMQIYQDVKIEQTVDEEIHSIDERKRQLLGAYVKKQFCRAREKDMKKGKATRRSEALTKKWLAWQAKNMQQHGQTVFLIEQLQNSWLSKSFERTAHWILSIIFAGLVAWLFVGLIYGLLVGLLVGLTGEFTGELAGELVKGPILGLIIGLILGLMFSIGKKTQLLCHMWLCGN